MPDMPGEATIILSARASGWRCASKPTLRAGLAGTSRSGLLRRPDRLPIRARGAQGVTERVMSDYQRMLAERSGRRPEG